MTSTSATAFDASGSESTEPEAGFSKSMIISGIRCVLTYVILPFVAPFLGIASGVGPVIGLVVGVVALAANVFSIRRFWAADHKWKKHVTVLHLGVIVLLTFLVVYDIQELLA